MAAAELPRPGVEVVQVIRTTTPTVVTPTLVPCVVGVAKQVVELLLPDGSGGKILNSDALINLPAFFTALDATGNPLVYTGLDGLHLVFDVNDGPPVDVLFADLTAAGLTPNSVVAAINKALGAAGVNSAIAETIGDAFRLRSTGLGQFQTIRILATTSPAVATTFGVGIDRTYTGSNTYGQLEEVVPVSNYPDPRGNLGELAVDADTVRAFLAMSPSNFLELSRDEAFLRNGSVNAAAVITGTVDLTTLTFPDDVQGLTLGLIVAGGTAQPVSLTASETSAALLVARINTATTGLVATLSPTNHLVLTSDDAGASASLAIAAGTANTVLGLTLGQTASGASIQVTDDGNGDNFSPLLNFPGVNFNAVGTAATVTGTVVLSTLAYPADLAGKTIEVSDGQQLQTITFSDTIADAAAVLAAINAVVGSAAGGRMLASLATGHLQLGSTHTGADSMVWVRSGTALSVLGLTANTLAYGALGHAMAGDALYIDGLEVGTIIKVAPGGITSMLKVNVQLPLTTNAGNHWHIIAKNLDGVAVDRPLPDMQVDASKTVILKNTLLRDTVGNPVPPTQGKAPLYLAYTAVRRDVSPMAATPSLLRFDNQTQLGEALEPVDTRNPLALGLFFAMVNAPGVQVTGLGVDAVSEDAPFGTAEAFTRAAEFLEAFEVYAIAPLTHDPTVGQIFNTHVNFMSEATQKGERIALFNSEQPTTALDTLVASGANGNTSGSTGLTIDTGIPNLATLLMNKGVSPIGVIPTTAGVFLDIASDSKHYSIAGVSGSLVTIRTTFAPGTNDDNFYSTTALNHAPLPAHLIGETFAIRIRGAALVTVDGRPDKQKIAETYAAIGQAYGNRRFWHTMPDQCAATIGGIEQVLEGFYMNAGIVGMIGQQPPQQSFTNFPMAGYTRVIGSSNYFSETQLNIMAGGGTYIIVQDAPQGPLISRMALSTDLTSVETRTDSITKVVDFTAKFLRRGLKNFIGRFNITQAFLDQLGTVIGGLGGFLVEVGVLIGFNLNNIVQDEQQPDAVLIDVLLDPPYPCNYLRLTLAI